MRSGALLRDVTLQNFDTMAFSPSTYGIIVALDVGVTSQLRFVDLSNVDTMAVFSSLYRFLYCDSSVILTALFVLDSLLAPTQAPCSTAMAW